MIAAGQLMRLVFYLATSTQHTDKGYFSCDAMMIPAPTQSLLDLENRISANVL